MQHAEEGTLHSYLDGELAPAEVIELERHLSVCAPCRAKLTEAKSFLGLADELIPLLDTVPAGTKTPATAPKLRRGWPVRPALLAWAASVVLAGGVGYAWHAQQVTVAPAEALRQLSDASSNAAPTTSQPAQPIDEPTASPPAAATRRDRSAGPTHDALSPTTPEKNSPQQPLP